jgi:hypothetical protein
MKIKSNVEKNRLAAVLEVTMEELTERERGVAKAESHHHHGCGIVPTR